MRSDNVGDYPWLLFSVATLMEEYVRLREEDGQSRSGRGDRRIRILEGLIDGLTPDPWAFTGAPPEALRPYDEEHAGFREAFAEHRDDLLEELEGLRPDRGPYSPLSYHCNFPHNAIMAKVSIQLADENAPNLPMDAMFTRAEPWQPVESEAGDAAEGSQPSAGDDASRAQAAEFVSANHPEALARYSDGVLRCEPGAAGPARGAAHHLRSQRGAALLQDGPAGDALRELTRGPRHPYRW